MSDSIYAPPAAEVSAPAGNGPRYYVVSLTKFMVLAILTSGLYFVYWMYKNWQLIKQQENNNSWPIARAIFMIFWLHSLLNDVDAQLRRKDKPFSWRPKVVATTFVVMALAAIISGQIVQFVTGALLPPLGLQAALTLMPIVYALILRPAQHAINTASDDEDGDSNAKFSAANWLWVFFGVVIWGMGLFTLYLVYSMGLQ